MDKGLFKSAIPDAIKSVSGAPVIKPQLDHKQIITEVQEVLCKAQDRTLSIGEICKAISKPDPFFLKNKRDFRMSVFDVLKRSRCFIPGGVHHLETCP